MTTGTTTGYTGSGYSEAAYTPEAMQGLADRCCGELSRAVDANPVGSLLTAFGAGLGIGVALALTVALPQAKPKKRSMPEELGDRVLAAIQDLIPDAVSKRFG